jgi:CheY-like chemotaxis protein
MTKILLVEDDKSLREIYGVRLLAEGYDIVSAGDGEEALAIAIKERPALIISDVMMPKISGFDMLDVLRSTTETHDIKVIMMTALSSEEHRKRGEALNADRYLVKSQVGIEDVVRTVHDVLQDAPADAVAAPAAPIIASPAPVAATPPPPPPPPPAAAVPTGAPAVAPPITPSVLTPAGQSAAAPLPDSSFVDSAAPTDTQAPARRQTLGERTIQPLERPEDPMAVSLADKMSQELSNGSVLASSPAPVSPAIPPANTVVTAPVAPPPPAAPTSNDSALPTPSAPPTPADFVPPPPPQPQDFPGIEKDEADLAAHLQFEPSPPPTDDKIAEETVQALESVEDASSVAEPSRPSEEATAPDSQPTVAVTGPDEAEIPNNQAVPPPPPPPQF